MLILDDKIYGLRCPKCRFSSEFMELPKADIESGVKLKCPECQTELVDDPKARPLLQNMRCPLCNIGFTKSRKHQCHYCGALLVPDTKSSQPSQQPLTSEPPPRM